MANSNSPYGFRPYSQQDGGVGSVLKTVTLASGVGCKPGDILTLASGYCSLIGATGTSADFVAQGYVTAAAGEQQKVSALPLYPGVKLRFQTSTLSAGNVGTAYDIVPTTGAGYLNTGATSYAQITIDDLAPGSAYGQYAEALGHVVKGRFVD